MKILNVVLLTVSISILLILAFNRFLIIGSEKIPAFMLSQAQALHPEITLDQRKDAEQFFRRFPFAFKWCFDKLLNDAKVPSELKNSCIVFLPVKNPSWALKYLFKFLKSDDWEIRQGAAEGLGLYLCSQEIFSKLSDAWAVEKNEKVQLQLTTTLLKCPEKAIEVFNGRMNDPDNRMKIMAA